jgi:predicted RNase H-like HicB family nuclease
MKFPVVLHKDPDSEYGVSVPDLPGCFSAGQTVELALDAVMEAIECHVEGLLMDGLPVPAAQPVEAHRKNRDYTGGLWALADLDLSKVSGKAKRVNITLPEHLLAQIDSFAAKTGDTRPGFLVHAAMEYVTAHQSYTAASVGKRPVTKKQARASAGV